MLVLISYRTWKEKPTRKCGIKFEDNFEVIQCHMNLSSYDTKAWKKDVKNIVGPTRQ
jgi:hypothetical protein